MQQHTPRTRDPLRAQPLTPRNSTAVSSLDVFTQEPPSGLSLPAEPAALFRDASFLA